MNIRQKRKTQIYHMLKTINEEIECCFDKYSIIYNAITENCNTTQLNQIFIALKVNFEKYRGIE